MQGVEVAESGEAFAGGGDAGLVELDLFLWGSFAEEGGGGIAALTFGGEIGGELSGGGGNDCDLLEVGQCDVVFVDC